MHEFYFILLYIFYLIIFNQCFFYFKLMHFNCKYSTSELYCHVSVVLMRQNAQVLLAHAAGAR